MGNLWKQLRCPTTDELRKCDAYMCVCVHTKEYYSAIRKNEHVLCRLTDETGDYNVK
jgi:hypothetical protein